MGVVGAKREGTTLSGTTTASTDANPYLDDKVELPTQLQNSHELANNETALPALVLPTAADPVELPDTSVEARNGSHGAAAQLSSQVNTLYAPHLVPPTSPGGVSDLTSADDDHVQEGDTENVSPVSPVARKPADGSSQLQVPGSGPEQATEATSSLSREKSTELKKNKSRIWKMLGGGSVHDKLKPASGTQ